MKGQTTSFEVLKALDWRVCFVQAMGGEKELRWS